MTIDQWMKENPDLVYETLGELSVTKLARLIFDDIAMGAYIFEQLNETYKDAMAARYLPREPDTEQTAQIRALNEENRRAHG